MKRGDARSTIQDVASAAGVSIATVSRVFSQSSKVSAPTRAKVEAVAKRLRYAPNLGARSLVTRRTHTVGVLLPDFHGSFFVELLRGIDGAARQLNYQLLVSGFHGHADEMEAGIRSTRGRVDGLLLAAPEIALRRLEKLVPDDTPAVLLMSPLARKTSRFDTINVDNEAGVVALVDHLVALGHRRIAIVKGPERNNDARERLLGFRRAVRSHGLSLAGRLEWNGDFSESSGYRAGQQLATHRPLPTAVVAANDEMAIGVLTALREQGIAVPTQMAVVGFDDVPVARSITPALTTVRVAMEQLGRRAMERLTAVIHRPTEAKPGSFHVKYRPELVVRLSSGSTDDTGRVTTQRRRTQGARAPERAEQQARRTAGKGRRRKNG